MPKPARGWLERTRSALHRHVKGRFPKGNLAQSAGNRIARRLIAEVVACPSTMDDRQAAGLVHVIDLSVVRHALGTKWPTYADAVHRITVRTIEHHLDTVHDYTREGDRYLLRFTDAASGAARNHARAISDALATYLFASGDHGPAAWSGRDLAPRSPPAAVTTMNPSRIASQLKLLLDSARNVMAGRPLDDHGARRDARCGDAAEPRLSAVSRPDAESAKRTSTAGGSPAPFLADSVPPSRSTAAEPIHVPANDDDVPCAGSPGGFCAPAPTDIAADFRSPSQPAMTGEIDLDAADSLERAMKAAVARLTRESERAAFAPPYRLAKR